MPRRQTPTALRICSFMRFPVLLPALPQPWHIWGLLAAMPSWAPQCNIAVFDLLAVGGRLFAAQVPILANHPTVHSAACQCPSGYRCIDVHIIVGFSTAPLVPDREIRLLPGQCGTFVPATALPAPVSTPDGMLLSSQAWADGPAFPQVTVSLLLPLDPTERKMPGTTRILFRV